MADRWLILAFMRYVSVTFSTLKHLRRVLWARLFDQIELAAFVAVSTTLSPCHRLNSGIDLLLVFQQAGIFCHGCASSSAKMGR